jgi:RNA polymerase sigma-70 factor (ECF subfamily)
MGTDSPAAPHETIAAMLEDSSFHDLMTRLRTGDEDAAAAIFKQFQSRLVALARSRLDAQLRQKEDPEDMVQSVFRSFFRRAAEGQFDVENRERLWSLLTVITLRKCGHRIDYHRAARRDVRREASVQKSADDSAAGWDAIAREPTPSEVAMLTETVEQLMRDLKERDRQILELALQGEAVADISRSVGYSERTVERALERVRKKLEEMRAANSDA